MLTGRKSRTGNAQHREYEEMARVPRFIHDRRLLRAAGAACILAGAGLQVARPTLAAVKPDFQTRSFQVVSVGNASLVVKNGAGTQINVTVDPTASLHRRFYGSFSLSNLNQIEPNDRIQMGYRVNGNGGLTAYMIQDYSLQVAHTEVKGLVTGVAADHSSFTYSITQSFGGSNAAFHAGQSVTVYTPNPASIPVTYAQGGPTCGNASCMVSDIYLELYGRSDRPNLNVNDPRSIVQVVKLAPQVVRATSD